MKCTHCGNEDEQSMVECKEHCGFVWCDECGEDFKDESS